MTHPFLILSALALMGGGVEGCRIPRAHEQFSGVVVRVIDSDTIVVATAACSALHVRLQDFFGPELREPGGREARAVLASLALNRRTSCEVTKGLTAYSSFGRPIAICRVGGVSVGQEMRRLGVPEGGRGFKPTPQNSGNTK